MIQPLVDPIVLTDFWGMEVLFLILLEQTSHFFTGAPDDAYEEVKNHWVRP